jgi:hypothetical protein
MWKWDHIQILSQRISADVSGVGGAVKGEGGLEMSRREAMFSVFLEKIYLSHSETDS